MVNRQKPPHSTAHRRSGRAKLNHHSPFTIDYLLYRSEDRGRVVGDAEGDAGARAELGEALDACGVEAQAGGPDLKAEAELALRLGAERCRAAARVGAPVNLRGDVDLLVDAEDSGRAVEQHVVLREELRGRCVDSYAEIGEGVEAAVLAEALAD